MPSRVPAATHTLAVLQYLAAQSGPVPARAIARKLGLPRSSTYDLLTAMAEEHFVTHFPEDEKWGLGITAFEVGTAYLRHDPLERLARPLLARLVDEVGETAHLGVLHGRDLMYLLKEQPRHPVTLISDIGVRLPAHLTASGRAVLAHLPDPQVRALFPSSAVFVDRTDSGPRSLIELRRMMSAERRQGYAVEEGFITTGYASIATAVFDYLARPVAAIGVTFRSEARPPEEWPGIAARARRTANELTARLGGRSQPPTSPD